MLIGGLVSPFAGCSGINASHSVSPIDFLLPGAGHFLYVPDKSPRLEPGTNNTFAALQPLTFQAERPQ
jgi:hypothetical protein